jgi:hypothetical protein
LRYTPPSLKIFIDENRRELSVFAGTNLSEELSGEEFSSKESSHFELSAKNPLFLAKNYSKLRIPHGEFSERRHFRWSKRKKKQKWRSFRQRTFLAKNPPSKIFQIRISLNKALTYRYAKNVFVKV